MADKALIDESLCSGCMLCARVCLLNFEQGPDGKARVSDNAAFCVSCGHCAAVCPVGAISIPGTDMDALEPIDESDRPSYEQLMAFLKMRRSRREFTDQSVPREVIDKLLAAAVQAPNGINRRNVHYTVITNRDVLRELVSRISGQMAKMMSLMRKPLWRLLFKMLNRRLYSELQVFRPLMDTIVEAQASGTDMVTYNAPCAILIHTTRDDMCGSEDSVYCAARIELAAETLGLGTCVIGFLTAPINGDRRLRELSGVPRDHKVHTSLIVGYPQFRYVRSAPKAAAQARYV